MYSLRPYQQLAVDAGMDYFASKRNKPAVMVLPTGSGKSLVIAQLAKQAGEPIIVFQPTKEILEQNYGKLMDYGAKGVSIYSASKGQKRIDNITLATIGSVHRKTELFSHFKHIIVDECHLVGQAGMYNNFLDEVGEKVIGLTATPYRLHNNSFGSMLRFLTRTKPKVFSKVIHVTQIPELVSMGFFARTEYYSINGFARKSIRLNSTGADYLDTSLQEYYSKAEFDKKLIRVISRLLDRGRKRILVFTKFVDEAHALAQRIGDKCTVIDGSMPKKEREEVIRRFRSGETPVIANVGVLTVGFDYPELDTVVLARPTRSLALYYQMVGRCVRPHHTKESAWIVDMCGNYNVFGRVEDLELVELRNNIWVVMSKGRPLTNVYLDEYA
ncbi:MAG: DEAD/DEAH box helicase [Spirochaetia bacterium]|nr:DEAD/DEAH box helicase [Spirochaetia bacterium]